MNCPRCRDDLRQTPRMGVEIDFCPRCRGVWLDGGELEKLIERSQSYDAGAGQGYSQAPSHGHDQVPPQGFAPAQGYGTSSDHRHDTYRSDDRHHESHRRDDRHHDSGHGHKHHKKKKGFLGEIFDIFD